MTHEEDSGSAPADGVEPTEAERRREVERQIRQLDEPERVMFRHELSQRAQELLELEEEKKQQLVHQALGKFGFFMHMTAFLTGCAYLVLLGVFVPRAMPWIFIPIGLWAVGFAYHGWRAWHPRPPGRKAADSLEEVGEQPESEEP
jgi:hypothetical protein